MKKLLLIALIFVSGTAMAQNVGIGTANPDESAILDLKSSNKGFLLPRLTEKQKALIPQPAEGLMIYQTDASQGVYLYQAGNWKNMGSANATTTTNSSNPSANVVTYTPNYLLTADGSGNISTSRLYLEPFSGNLGLGTTSLNLGGFGNSFTMKASNGYFGFEMYGASTTAGGQLDFGGGNTRYATIVGEYESNNNGLLSFRTLSSGSMVNVLNIKSNGSVGIGTASPNFSGFGTALTIKANTGYSGFEMYGSTITTGGQLDFGGGNKRYATIVGEYESNDNGLLSFRTLKSGNMINVLNLKSNGSVGIGTNFPNLGNFGTALTIKANVGYSGFEMYGSTITTGGQLDFGGGETRYASIVGEYESSNYGTIVFRTLNNGTMVNSLKLRSNGNVGIGNDLPTEKLDVTGSIKQSAVSSSLLKADGTGKLVAATAGTDFVTSGTNTIGTIAKFSASGTVANSALTELAITNGTGVKLDSKSAGYLAVGDFGLGTPMSIPTGYRLVVQDGIITEKVKVAVRNQTDWADYVFEPNYSLMPLNEVETFVKENKHLPNVPSADQMVEQGVEVGKTSKMFMEKIEELTLYMIELKKEIEALKAENAKLMK